MKKSILFCLFAILSLTFLSAKNYIAAVNGTSAGAGTIASPYDIATAVSKAIAGDTVYIRGGQYMMTAQLSLSRGGNSSSFINIWAYPGDSRPILDFYNRGYSGTNASSERGISISKSYYYIRGLDITRAGDNGMHISGSYNIIENCRFYKNCDTGLQITGSSISEGYNQIIDCDAYENFDYKSTPTGGNSDGFACKLTVGPGNKFIRCRSWANSDDAYDCYGSANDIYFKDCWAIANGQASYVVNDYPGGTTGTVINNGNGNGFKVGGNSAVGGAILIGCVSTGHKIMSSSNKGFDQNNSVGRVFVFNCISYNDGRGYSFPLNTDARGEHQFYNNILLSASNSNSIKSTSVHKTNTWNGISVSASDFVNLIVENGKADRNADGSLTLMDGLFRLKSTANLIDKGTVVAIDTISLPYFGLKPDVGPFEYNPSTSIGAIADETSGVSVFYSASNKELTLRGDVSAVEIYNLNGTKLFNQNMYSVNKQISVINYPKGIYLVKLVLHNGMTTTKKIIIE
jgi:hypothetical protein